MKYTHDFDKLMRLRRQARKRGHWTLDEIKTKALLEDKLTPDVVKQYINRRRFSRAIDVLITNIGADKTSRLMEMLPTISGNAGKSHLPQ